MIERRPAHLLTLLLCVILSGRAWGQGQASAQTPAPPASQEVVPTGLVFVEGSKYSSIPLASTPLTGSQIPPSVDLSNRFPQPKTQGTQGSCVGWAIGYALKSYTEMIKRNWDLGFPDHVFSPAYIYNQLNSSSDCKGGITYPDALNLLHSDGVAPWSSFPYDPSDCSKQPDTNIRQLAKQFSVVSYRRVNVQDPTEIEDQLAAGFPVLAGIVVDAPFWHLASPNYTQYIGPQIGAHALVVIGYDHAKSQFRLINSWGDQWGDHGYVWLSYTAFSQ